MVVIGDKVRLKAEGTVVAVNGMKAIVAWSSNKTSTIYSNNLVVIEPERSEGRSTALQQSGK